MSKIILPQKVLQELNLAARRAKPKHRKLVFSSRHLENAIEDFDLEKYELVITTDTLELICDALTPDRAVKVLQKLQRRAIPKSIWKLAIDPYLVQHKIIGKIVIVFEFVKRSEACAKEDMGG